MASIRKRTWTARDVERSAWVLDYLDQQGTRRLKTFATKKEADEAAVTVRHEVKHGIHTPDKVSKTVAEAFEAWIADREAHGRERSTIKQRREHLALHVMPFIGNEKLSSLTAPMIKQFANRLRAE